MKTPFWWWTRMGIFRGVSAAVLGILAGAGVVTAGDPLPGRIAAWTLSRPVGVSTIDREHYLDAAARKALDWLRVESESDGLVDIVRHWKAPAGGTAKVFARTTLHADRAEPRAFAFGFSEALSIYLNGRIVYRGQAGARAPDAAARLQLACEHTVWLPLEAGDNELMLAVSGSTNGWGFVGRDLDAVFVHESLSKRWEVAEGLAAPESVAYDRERRVLYVSNFSGGSIAKVSLDGNLLAPAWVTGLKQPTGLVFARGRLYAIDRAGLVEIDPGDGSIVRRRPIPGAGFPNDVAAMGDGTIYVTDMTRGRLYQITADKDPELWLEDPALAQVNGVLAEPGRLLVGVTSDGTVKTVDLATKRIETFVTVGPGALMDGLVSDGLGGCLFSDYFGRIFHVDPAGRRTLLLDSTGPREFCADICYVPEENLLVVPSLFGQRLTAYRFTPEKR